MSTFSQIGSSCSKRARSCRAQRQTTCGANPAARMSQRSLPELRARRRRCRSDHRRWKHGWVADRRHLSIGPRSGHHCSLSYCPSPRASGWVAAQRVGHTDCRRRGTRRYSPGDARRTTRTLCRPDPIGRGDHELGHRARNLGLGKSHRGPRRRKQLGTVLNRPRSGERTPKSVRRCLGSVR